MEKITRKSFVKGALGVGVPATEQLPEKFIGLDTEDAINGVDGLSGATITSNALKQAVINALLQAK